MKLIDTPAQMMARRAVEVRQAATTGGAVISPCISVCRMDAASGLCEGCFRTLEEIADWSGLDDTGRRAIWMNIGQRAGAA